MPHINFGANIAFRIMFWKQPPVNIRWYSTIWRLGFWHMAWINKFKTVRISFSFTEGKTTRFRSEMCSSHWYKGSPNAGPLGLEFFVGSKYKLSIVRQVVTWRGITRLPRLRISLQMVLAWPTPQSLAKDTASLKVAFELWLLHPQNKLFSWVDIKDIWKDKLEWQMETAQGAVSSDLS